MRPDGPRATIVGPDSGPEPPFPIRLSGEVIKGFGRGSKELGIPTANIPIEGLAVGGHDELESGVYFGWAGLDFDADDVSAAAPATDSSSPQQQQHEDEPPKENDSSSSSSTTTLSAATAKAAALIASATAQHDDDGNGDDDAARRRRRGRVHPMVMSVGWNPYYKNTKRSVEVHIMRGFARDFYGSRMRLVMLGFVRPEYDYVSREALVEDIEVDIEVAGRSLAREGWARFRRDEYLLDG